MFPKIVDHNAGIRPTVKDETPREYTQNIPNGNASSLGQSYDSANRGKTTL